MFKEFYESFGVKSRRKSYLESNINVLRKRFAIFVLILCFIIIFIPRNTEKIIYQSYSNSQISEKIAVFALGEPIFQVDDIRIPVDSNQNVAPILKDGKIMIPLDSLTEFLDAHFIYDEFSRIVTISKENTKININITDNSSSFENAKNNISEKINLNTPLIFKNGHIFIEPVQFEDYLAMDIQTFNNKLIILRNYHEKTIIIKPQDISSIKTYSYNLSKDFKNNRDGTYTLEFETEYDTKHFYKDYANNSKIDLIRIVGALGGTISWDVRQIQAREYLNYVNENFDTTREVRVAVIDSGIDETHPDLNGRLTEARYNFVDDNLNTTDKYGHGTMVSGIIANNTTLNVKIMPIKVTDTNGKGNSNDVARGIEFAVNNGSDVINLSLSIDGGHSKAVESAIDFAISNNVAVVIAAGNTNSDVTHICPMHIQNAIVVGAVDQNSNKTRFSNYGSTITVSAPGDDIFGPYINNSYRIADGTSLSAPFVSAEIALIKTVNNDINLESITHIIKLAVNPVTSNQYMGTGVIDMYKLINHGSFQAFITPKYTSEVA